MAEEVERLMVRLEATQARFEKQMASASNSADRRARQIERRFETMNANINRSFQNVLRGGVAMLGGLGVREIQQMADTWTDFSARVGLAVRDMDMAPAVMQRIYETAQRTYSALDQTAESFISNAQTLRELGKSTKEQLDYTEALNNALVVSGAKAQRAASVQDALAKAMAAGELRGQNLNTVIETGGRVAEALAAELGVSTLELRNVGQQGKITGDVIFNALTKRLADLRDEADAMPATISDGFVKIRNALTRFIGTMDQAQGVSAALAGGLVFVADNFDSVAFAAAAAAAVLLGRYVPGLIRATAAQAAMVATNPFLMLATAIGGAAFALHAFGDGIAPIEGDMANLHDYAGVVWDGIKAGASTAASAVSDAFLAGINMITDGMDGVAVTWNDVADFLKRIANQIIGEFQLLYDVIVIAFTKLPAAIADQVVKAMNGMVALVESGINSIVRGVNAAIRALNSLGSYAGMGELIGEVGPVELGRLESSYADAGAAVGVAYGEALQRAARDHVGDALSAWRDAANRRAAERVAANETTDDPLAGDGRPGVRVPSTGGGGGGRGGRGRGKQSEWQREIEKIRERTAALVMETEIQASLNPLIDDYDYALTKARATQELLTAAKKAGVTVTPELRAQIDQLAETYAQATVAANRLAEGQDNARKAAEEMRSLGKDVLGGFISDLRAGKSGAEALASAIDKIAQKLIDMALNNLFENAFSGGGFGGGGRGLLGGFLIPGILHKGGVAGRDGYGHGRAVSNGMFTGAKRYHRGGIAGLQPGEIPAILQKGEVVVPKGAALAGQEGGRLLVDVGVSVDDDGKIQAYVRGMSRQAASAGAAMAVKQVADNMGGLVANSQMRTS